MRTFTRDSILICVHLALQLVATLSSSGGLLLWSRIRVETVDSHVGFLCVLLKDTISLRGRRQAIMG